MMGSSSSSSSSPVNPDGDAEHQLECPWSSYSAASARLTKFFSIMKWIYILVVHMRSHDWTTDENRSHAVTEVGRQRKGGMLSGGKNVRPSQRSESSNPTHVWTSWWRELFRCAAPRSGGQNRPSHISALRSSIWSAGWTKWWLMDFFFFKCNKDGKNGEKQKLNHKFVLKVGESNCLKKGFPIFSQSTQCIVHIITVLISVLQLPLTSSLQQVWNKHEPTFLMSLDLWLWWSQFHLHAFHSNIYSAFLKRRGRPEAQLTI